MNVTSNPLTTPAGGPAGAETQGAGPVSGGTTATSPLRRLHPSGWPLAAWVGLTVVADLLRVDYTLGAFSLGTIAALLAGTWLGPARGALSQLGAAAVLATTALLVPVPGDASSWGFRLGRAAAAWLAGRLVPPDERGARVSRPVRTAVAVAAAFTVFAVLRWGLYIGPGPVGGYFVMTFLMAAVIAVFYAWRIVPEPLRVVGYIASLLPYYAIGLLGTWVAVSWWPQATASVRPSLRSIVFHGYLAQLPGDLIGAVVIAYLVCAIDRAEAIPR